MKIIHITDTHLLKKGELLHGLDPYKRFQLCVRSINENHSDAYCIVVTGDLADRGEEEAYQLFKELVASTGLPVHSIIGNHDSRHNYIKQFPEAAIDSAGFIQSAIETPVGVFLLLDTQLAGSHSGTYCKQRQQWLRDQLTHYRAAPIYIFMHHPPFDLSFPCMDKIGLDSKESFASVINTHTNIRHIFFGHAHRPLCGNWNGMSFSSLRGTNHQFNLDFDNLDDSENIENPEYAIVFIDDNQLVVHTHSYLQALT